MSEAKPFSISKHLVVEAFRRVKANRGAAGVDGQSLEAFEKDLKNNLYTVWNRMSSGSYFPPPVRLVEIPKRDGRTRPLGIPTVADRMAQMVVKQTLEPLVEPFFHRDSYGYRPGKSALDAVGVARKRCWSMDWVVDLDIRDFFGSLDHDLLMKAVKHHTDLVWIHLYVVPLPEWILKPYIDVAAELGWISRSGKDVAAVLRDYRNYIHPEKERSHGIALNQHDSAMFWEVTKSLATNCCRQQPLEEASRDWFAGLHPHMARWGLEVCAFLDRVGHKNGPSCFPLRRPRVEGLD